MNTYGNYCGVKFWGISFSTWSQLTIAFYVSTMISFRSFSRCSKSEIGSIWRIYSSPWSDLVNSTHWLPKVTNTFTGVSNGFTSGFWRKNRFYCFIVTSVCPETVLTEQILYFLVAYLTTTLGVFILTVLTKLQANSYHGTNF